MYVITDVSKFYKVYNPQTNPSHKSSSHTQNMEMAALTNILQETDNYDYMTSERNIKSTETRVSSYWSYNYSDS